MYATPAAAPQPAANASGRPGSQPPSGLSAASTTAAARLPTIQSASAAMAGPARQNSSTKPTRSAGVASWATKNSGLPRRTSKSGCATAMHQRLAMCNAARRSDTFIVGLGGWEGEILRSASDRSGIAVQALRFR